MFIALKGLKGHSFIIYLSQLEHRDMPSSHLHYIECKEMMGEEVFQMHVATPIYFVCFFYLGLTSLSTIFQSYRDGVWMWPLPYMLHVLCFYTRPDKREAKRSFLSLLVLKRVFFTCCCAKWSSFPPGVSFRLQIPYFKILPRQPNKMVTGHKTHKLGRQSSNDHNCQLMVQITSNDMKKMQFNHFLIVSLWVLSNVSNQTKRQITITLAILNPHTQATFLPH